MSTSLEETFTRLVDVAGDLMVPLRLGREADPEAADALKAALQELRKCLREGDSVPKPISRFLVELYPLFCRRLMASQLLVARPAATYLEVSGLAHPELKFELEITVYKGSSIE